MGADRPRSDQRSNSLEVDALRAHRCHDTSVTSHALPAPQDTKLLRARNAGMIPCRHSCSYTCCEIQERTNTSIVHPRGRRVVPSLDGSRVFRASGVIKLRLFMWPTTELVLANIKKRCGAYARAVKYAHGFGLNASRSNIGRDISIYNGSRFCTACECHREC